MIAAVGPLQCAIGKAATAAAVDCTVSSWVVDAACLCPNGDSASCSQSVFRTIVTPAKNGGACPSLSYPVSCSAGRFLHASPASLSGLRYLPAWNCLRLLMSCDVCCVYVCAPAV